ncbi:Shedu immune nuclease family protein [Hyphomonas sp. NPDC076900]|uniref:Shedu immune nuclease family protein n=1 Tax=unclassified Hyphomonas TaxID=2630699 RepID=UPI003CFF6B37
MTDEFDEAGAHFSRRTDKTILGGRFPGDLGEPMRIMSKVVDVQPAFEFATIKGQIVLRETPAGRHAIKATFFESDRRITVLTIQKFNAVSGASEKFSFSFVGSEIRELKEFLAGVETVGVDDPRKRHIPDEELHEIVLNRAQINRLVSNDESLVIDILKNTNLRRDVVAVRYRQDQLSIFERLLSEEEFFQQKMVHHKADKPERLWQKFFELNTWIFGYGLSYQFLSGLDKKKLEQAVSGYDLSGPGKVVDAVMKTRGIVNSLCFVEVKTHDTDLLSTDTKRSGVWHPSSKLTASVAQIHVTVQSALETLQEIVRPKEKNGDPTGEQLFNIAPKSFLVVGSLSQFQTEHGTNVEKFKSFELYRRNLNAPEIITFDELFERARFIVSQSK